MADAPDERKGTRRLPWLAAVLSIGGVGAALLAAIGTGMGAWSYGAGLGALRYAFYAAVAGGLVAIVAFVLSRRSGARVGRLNLLAFAVSLLFTAYLGNLIVKARSVPAIHDATTNLNDPPQFRTLAVRADNLAKIPDGGRPELAALPPEARWKRLHHEAYGDLRTLRLPIPVAQAHQLVRSVIADRGWKLATTDANSEGIEATATSFFFRFKDDVVVRVRPDSASRSASLVDMRSISRVGVSDVGVNADRIRRFMRDLEKRAKAR